MYIRKETQVCCIVLQCVAVCCSVLQCIALFYSVLQCVAVCCIVWGVGCTHIRKRKCVAVRCSVQCAAACCSVLQYVGCRMCIHKETQVDRRKSLSSGGSLLSGIFPVSIGKEHPLEKHQLRGGWGGGGRGRPIERFHPQWAVLFERGSSWSCLLKLNMPKKRPPRGGRLHETKVGETYTATLYNASYTATLYNTLQYPHSRRHSVLEEALCSALHSVAVYERRTLQHFTAPCTLQHSMRHCNICTRGGSPGVCLKRERERERECMCVCVCVHCNTSHDIATSAFVEAVRARGGFLRSSWARRVAVCCRQCAVCCSVLQCVAGSV